jgi:hypothetical protein
MAVNPNLDTEAPMIRLSILIGILLVFFGVFSPAYADDADAAFRQRVAAFLDEWHDDAAHARMRYFDKIAADGVYIGTDKSERWVRDDFKVWAKPYFDKGQAWEFHAIKRNIAFTPDQRVIWFDEQLTTQMGICQASGVIKNGTDGLHIEHYQLSLTVPNDMVEHIKGEIQDYDAAHPGK